MDAKNIPVDIYCSTTGCWYLVSPSVTIVFTEDDAEAQAVASELGFNDVNYETTPFAFSEKSQADAFVKRIMYPAGSWILPFLKTTISRDGAYVIGIDGYVLD